VVGYSLEALGELIPELFTRVKAGEAVEIRVEGYGVIVLKSEADVESLELTLEILSDPEAMDDLRRSSEEAERGEAVDIDDLRTLFRRAHLRAHLDRTAGTMKDVEVPSRDEWDRGYG
jgi:PHD/YefM family antitoxin component YafN of YafNO toxin-antitoxin module